MFTEAKDNDLAILEDSPELQLMRAEYYALEQAIAQEEKELEHQQEVIAAKSTALLTLQQEISTAISTAIVNAVTEFKQKYDSEWHERNFLKKHAEVKSSEDLAKLLDAHIRKDPTTQASKLWKIIVAKHKVTLSAKPLADDLLQEQEKFAQLITQKNNNNLRGKHAAKRKSVLDKQREESRQQEEARQKQKLEQEALQRKLIEMDNEEKELGLMRDAEIARDAYLVKQEENRRAELVFMKKFDLPELKNEWLNGGNVDFSYVTDHYAQPFNEQKVPERELKRGPETFLPAPGVQVGLGLNPSVPTPAVANSNSAPDEKRQGGEVTYPTYGNMTLNSKVRNCERIFEAYFAAEPGCFKSNPIPTIKERLRKSSYRDDNTKNSMLLAELENNYGRHLFPLVMKYNVENPAQKVQLFNELLKLTFSNTIFGRSELRGTFFFRSSQLNAALDAKPLTAKEILEKMQSNPDSRSAKIARALNFRAEDYRLNVETPRI